MPRSSLRRCAVALIAVACVWLPRVAVVPASLLASGCQCPDRGSAMIFDAKTVARDPHIIVSGAACPAKSVECMRRDVADRCDVFWIDPVRDGTCIITVHFDDDGTEKIDVIQYENDTKYPCRGNVRPVDGDHVTRITSGT